MAALRNVLLLLSCATLAAGYVDRVCCAQGGVCVGPCIVGRVWCYAPHYATHCRLVSGEMAKEMETDKKLVAQMIESGKGTLDDVAEDMSAENDKNGLSTLAIAAASGSAGGALVVGVALWLKRGRGNVYSELA